MKTVQKISTFIVAFFLLIPGLVKFTNPFKHFFTVQIANSNLPLPELSFIMGQASEILTGALLFALLFFWKKFQPELAKKLFLLGNLMVYPIMAVAVYVHMHPDVPAEVLPFESKPPVLAVALIIGATINIIGQCIGRCKKCAK